MNTETSSGWRRQVLEDGYSRSSSADISSVWMAPACSMWVFLGGATSGLLYEPQMIEEDDCGATGGMKIGRGNRSTRRKPAPAPLCPPQISHDETRARNRAAAVGSQRLTAWAMARPLHVSFHALLRWTVGWYRPMRYNEVEVDELGTRNTPEGEDYRTTSLQYWDRMKADPISEKSSWVWNRG
jgi:hypothetical protein